MVLRRFDVHKATSVAEAVALRQRYGDDGAVYAGGTELLLAMKLGVARWPHLIDIKPIAALRTLAVTKDLVRIGATVTHWELERDPALASVLPVFARLVHRHDLSDRDPFECGRLQLQQFFERRGAHRLDDQGTIGWPSKVNSPSVLMNGSPAAARRPSRAMTSS